MEIFKKEGFSREDYFLNYEKTKAEKGDFDADFIIELFAKIKAIDRKKIKKEINSVIDNSNKFIYEDFFDFAKSFNKHDLTLVSVGLKENQEAKIINAGIFPFFDKVSIPLKYKSGEIELMTKKYQSEKIFFIDDKAEQIDEAKKRMPQIIAIKMERPSGRHIFPKSKLADYIVKNLGEAKKIINKLR